MNSSLDAVLPSNGPYTLQNSFLDGDIASWYETINSPHLVFFEDDTGYCKNFGYDPAADGPTINCLASSWDPSPNEGILHGYVEAIGQDYEFIANGYNKYCIDITAEGLSCSQFGVQVDSRMVVRVGNDLTYDPYFSTDSDPPELPGIADQLLATTVPKNISQSFSIDNYVPTVTSSQLQIANAISSDYLTQTNSRVKAALNIQEVSVRCQTTSLQDISIANQSGTTITFSANNASTYAYNSYLWTFHDETSSADENPTYMYSEPGTYEVCLEIIDENECCGSICQDIVVTPPSCTCPMDEETLVIDATNPMTDSFSDLVDMGIYQSGGTLTGKDIVVKGAFTLDVNFTFSFCNFYFEPGSELIIESPGKIEINSNSTLQGCDKMWKGITVIGTEPENTFWFRQNIIKDAYAAIELMDGANVLQNSNEFIDNYIGVYARPTNNLKQNNGQPIILSSFKTNNQMLDPYDDQPAWSEVPFAGIHVSDLDHIIVRSISIFNFSLQNRFVGIQNGIIARNTNLVANDNIFSKLVGSVSLSEQRGRCIEGKNMIAMEAKNNLCVDSGGGILVANSPNARIVIDNNIIKKVSNTLDFHYGIYLSRNHNAALSVSNNDIYVGDHSSFAINCLRSNNLRSLNINYNDLFLKASRSGIRLDDISMMEGSFGHIDHNDVEKNKTFVQSASISINLTYDVSLEDNSVDVLTSDWGLGTNSEYYTSYSSHCQFRDNYVTYQQHPDAGFYQIGSIDNLYCCNIAERSRNGFFFSGVNQMLNLSSNEMRNCQTGLAIGNEITPQNNKGNLWVGTETNASIFVPMGSSADEIAQASKFRVNSVFSADTRMRPDDVSPSDAEAFWFEENGFGNASCGNSPACGIPPYPSNNGFNVPDDKSCDDFDAYIEALVGPKVTSIFQHQNKWTLYYYVFKHFDNLPIHQWRDCEVINEFMNSNPQMEQYVRVGKLFENAYSLTDNHAVSILNNQSIISSSLDEINALYDNAPEDFEIYAPDIHQYQNAINSSTQAIRDINTLVFNTADQRLTSVLSEIEALPVEYDFEEKLKTIWIGKVKVTLNGEIGLSSSEWLEIEAIANGCPEADGLALYEARGLLRSRAEMIYNFNDDRCEDIGKRSTANRTNSKMSIYPNPTSGILTIAGLDEYLGMIDINVYTSDGIIMYINSVENTDNLISLDINSLKNGIYILDARQDGGSILTQKVVITK